MDGRGAKNNMGLQAKEQANHTLPGWYPKMGRIYGCEFPMEKRYLTIRSGPFDSSCYGLWMWILPSLETKKKKTGNFIWSVWPIPRSNSWSNASSNGIGRGRGAPGGGMSSDLFGQSLLLFFRILPPQLQSVYQLLTNPPVLISINKPMTKDVSGQSNTVTWASCHQEK